MPPRSRLRSEAAQNRLLLKIYRISRPIAARVADEDEVDDLVQEVAADCLVRLRTRRLARTPRKLRPFVRKVVYARFADMLRKQHGHDERDGEHFRDRSLSQPEWMAVGPPWTESTIEAFREHVMTLLPRRCHVAYYMVRVEGASYKEAADRLGVTRDIVHLEIKRAHAAFRRELLKVGISERQIDQHVRPAGQAWGRGEERFKPPYVPNRQVAQVE